MSYRKFVSFVKVVWCVVVCVTLGGGSNSLSSFVPMAQAGTAATITLPFSYDFHINGTLDEASTTAMSWSPYWWVASGARLVISNGMGNTLAGNLPPGSSWSKYYNALNPVSTDKGSHPQNVFQMLFRNSIANPSVQLYVKQTADNLSNPVNKHSWNGESLLARYSDINNYYYAGIRADGAVTIKKKTNGIYQTLAYSKVFPGTYNATTSPNLIPKGEWIGLKMAVENDSSGNPKISLYMDRGKTGIWKLVAQAVDDPAIYGSPILTAGLVGVQSDFADAQFDDFLLQNAASSSSSSSSPVALLTDTFGNYSDGLITNEYAYWNPTDPAAKQSPLWEMTSGSLFALGGLAWTGIPDAGTPDALSLTANNSAVFRLTTKEAVFGDVAVTFDLQNQGLTSTSFTPPVDWDGVHIFLRYQSEYNLYYASINRRDNTIVIKKKVSGGSSNGGTYYSLSAYTPHQVSYGSWQNVKATVKNNTDGSVTIQLFLGGQLILSATDDGSIGGAPIRNPGKVGVRGDNANLLFKNFVVTQL